MLLGSVYFLCVVVFKLDTILNVHAVIPAVLHAFVSTF
jgi:hypothetical protein